MFGMVSDKSAICAIVDTWWDSQVRVLHLPGDRSVLDFSWAPSLGELAYPRRLLIRFDDGLDYVVMAKLYREYARSRGLLRTLAAKAEQTPAIRHYVKSVLYRWTEWNRKDGPAVLADIRRMQKTGLDVVFFYPKWSGLGYDPETGGNGDVARLSRSLALRIRAHDRWRWWLAHHCNVPGACHLRSPTRRRFEPAVAANGSPARRQDTSPISHG